GAAQLLGRTTKNSFPLAALELNKTYFWQVIAEGQQTVTPGAIWRFSVPPIGPVDHFAWGLDGTNHFAGAPRSATIEARDDFDKYATSFNGRVRLRGRATLPTETIGIASEPLEFPVGGFLPVSRLQSIYLASGLGGPRVLTGIALNIKDAPGELTRWTLRLK